MMPKGYPLPEELRLARRRETKRLWQRKYLERNRTIIKARKKADYHANKEKHSAKHKQIYQANAEAIKARANARYAMLRARMKTDKDFHAAWRRGQNIMQQAWREANPEKTVEYVLQRRAKQHGAKRYTLTPAQWREIKEAFDHRCAYCDKKTQRLTRDHITPVDDHGDHHVHNIVPACQSCNSSKGTKPPPTSVQPLLLTIAPERKKKAS
jgi:5-methylcytosine-specific restriction endonuclease McrA